MSSSSDEERKEGDLNRELSEGKSPPLKEKIKAYEEARPEKESGNLDDYLLSQTQAKCKRRSGRSFRV